MKYCLFIQLGSFERDWKQLGLDDDDLRSLEQAIMREPLQSPVVRGTGGLRKMRLAIDGRGKRAGARVCCAYFATADAIVLMAAYGKYEKDNLTAAECAEIKQYLTRIETLLLRR